jgi:hypothetical protein
VKEDVKDVKEEEDEDEDEKKPSVVDLQQVTLSDVNSHEEADVVEEMIESDPGATQVKGTINTTAQLTDHCK